MNSDDGFRVGGWIVAITTRSAAVIDGVRGALAAIGCTVGQPVTIPPSTMLRVEGATRELIGSRLADLGIEADIVEPTDDETRAVMERIARIILGTATAITDAPYRGELLPDTRRRLRNAMLSAFPAYDDLHPVFTLWMVRPPAVNTRAHHRLDTLYDMIIGLLLADGTLDEFLCGASRQTGNPALGATITTDFGHCTSCHATRAPGSCSRIP